MGGQGPAPKPAERRARRNADPVPQTVLPFRHADQPALPDCRPGDLEEPWPPATVRWWNRWGESAQAELMTATDWDFLLDTAAAHAKLWGDGDMSVLPELRLRVAKFGATLEDRARLRIVFADADLADGGQPPAPPAVAAAQARYAGLRPGAAGGTVVQFPGAAALAAVRAAEAAETTGGDEDLAEGATDALAGS